MAFQDYESTKIGKQLSNMVAGHPEESGFAIIRYPRPAFTARIMLTELAEKGLDAQYYIWEADTTGRNIGNHYFGVDTEANFRDLDIAAVGPVVREVSTAFDVFWNGDWSVPIEVLVDRPYTEEDLLDALATVRQQIAENDYPHPLDQDVATLEAELNTIFDDFIWAPGQIVWDDPAAIYKDDQKGRIGKAWMKKLAALQSELLIESAYFVVPGSGVENLKKLHERGVGIRVLTNSLVSNDVLAAHAGYADSRVDLLKNGVELYELRLNAGAVTKSGQQSMLSGESKAALHTKTMVFDRDAVFIGSFNLDPRSMDINTEAGLYVESSELAAQVIEYMDVGVKPENSYRVILDEDGDLVWITENNGQEERYTKDPGSSSWQRFKAGVIRILPVKGQL